MAVDPLDLVAPVDRKFFSSVEEDPVLSSAAKDYLVNKVAGSSMKIQELRDSIVGRQQQEQLNDLRIERERLNLREARRKIEEQEVIPQKVDELGSSISSVLDDPDLAPEQKKSELARLRMDNSKFITLSPIVREKFAAAESTLPATLTPYQKMMVDRAEEREATQAAYYKSKSEAELREAERKQQEEDLDTEYSVFNKSFDTLQKARFSEAPVVTESGRPSLTEKAETDSFSNPADRAEAISFLSFFGGMTPEELSNQSISDRQLLNMVLDIYPKKKRDFFQRKVQKVQSSSVSNLGIPTE